MSAPLSTAELTSLTRQHTLKRARLGEFLVVTDLDAFRAPFGEKWHKLGTGHADPEFIPLTGAVEGATREASQAALSELLEDLPTLQLLKVGTWEVPVSGATGPVAVTPTLAGWQVQFTLVRAEES